MLFKLDIEMWHAVRKQKKQGELLVAVVEDQTLKKPMELIRQCLLDQGVLGSPYQGHRVLCVSLLSNLVTK